jgi:predicted phosphodiesterase
MHDGASPVVIDVECSMKRSFHCPFNGFELMALTGADVSDVSECQEGERKVAGSGMCTPTSTKVNIRRSTSTVLPQAGFLDLISDPKDHNVTNVAEISLDVMSGAGEIASGVTAALSGHTHTRDYASHIVEGNQHYALSNLLETYALRNKDGKMRLNFMGLKSGSYIVRTYHHSAHLPYKSSFSITSSSGDVLEKTAWPYGDHPSGPVSVDSRVVVADGSSPYVEINCDVTAGTHCPLNGFEIFATEFADENKPSSPCEKLSCDSHVGVCVRDASIEEFKCGCPAGYELKEDGVCVPEDLCVDFRRVGVIVPAQDGCTPFVHDPENNTENKATKSGLSFLGSDTEVSVELFGHTHTRDYATTLDKDSEFYHLTNLLETYALRTLSGEMGADISGLSAGSWYEVTTYHYAKLAPGGASLDVAANGAKVKSGFKWSNSSSPKEISISSSVKADAHGKLKISISCDMPGASLPLDFKNRRRSHCPFNGFKIMKMDLPPICLKNINMGNTCPDESTCREGACGPDPSTCVSLDGTADMHVDFRQTLSAVDAPLQDGYETFVDNPPKPEDFTTGAAPRTEEYTSALSSSSSAKVRVTLSGHTHVRQYATELSSSSKDYGLREMLRTYALRNKAGTMKLTFENLKVGSYAITTFHHSRDAPDGSSVNVSVQGSSYEAAWSFDASSSAGSVVSQFSVEDGKAVVVSVECSLTATNKHCPLNGFYLHPVGEDQASCDCEFGYFVGGGSGGSCIKASPESHPERLAKVNFKPNNKPETDVKGWTTLAGEPDPKDAEGLLSGATTSDFADVGYDIDVSLQGHTHIRDYAAPIEGEADSKVYQSYALRNSEGHMTLRAGNLARGVYALTTFHRSKARMASGRIIPTGYMIIMKNDASGEGVLEDQKFRWSTDENLAEPAKEKKTLLVVGESGVASVVFHCKMDSGVGAKGMHCPINGFTLEKVALAAGRLEGEGEIDEAPSAGQSSSSGGSAALISTVAVLSALAVVALVAYRARRSASSGAIENMDVDIEGGPAGERQVDIPEFLSLESMEDSFVEEGFADDDVTRVNAQSGVDSRNQGAPLAEPPTLLPGVPFEGTEL